MKLKSLPTSLFVEVLDYLADYEHFQGLDHILDGEYTVLDVRSALRELSIHLRKALEVEKNQVAVFDFHKDERLSSQARNLLSALSPGDERRLLEKFGFLDI